jgi:hypothetical protein
LNSKMRVLRMMRAEVFPAKHIKLAICNPIGNSPARFLPVLYFNQI